MSFQAVRKDYTIRWYHFFLGPLNWKRQPPADAGKIGAPRHVVDYRVRDRDQPEDQAVTDEPIPAPMPATADSNAQVKEKNLEAGGSDSSSSPERENGHPSKLEASMDPLKVPIEGSLKNKAWVILRYRLLGGLLHGSSVDIHALQTQEGGFTGKRMNDVYARARQFPNEVEFGASRCSWCTACC